MLSDTDPGILKRASQMPDGMFPVAELHPPIRPEPTLPAEPYELGLTSAGAISAGAYIAGAMDMLVEALDAWQAAKDDPALKDNVPDHSVVLRVITGASAGAINAALLGVLRDRAFTHLPIDPTPEGGEEATGNPIFDAWVNRIGIDKLLADHDLRNGREPVSLLDGTALLDIARRALSDAANLPVIERPWLSDPLRVILTQTNCRGIPYFVPFEGGIAGQGMMRAGDQARFAITVPGGRPDSQPTPFPDETAIAGTPAPDTIWTRLTDACIASGAFPLGLPPRQMSAEPSDYAHRIYFQHENDLVSVAPRGKDWPAENDAAYTAEFPYVGIDGGVVDNDPFGLARDILAGGCGVNPREGNKAVRSVVMINPFPEAPELGPSVLKDLPLLKAAQTLLGVLLNQSRFKPKDLILAHLEDVYSRFLIVPKRDNPVKGQYSLACGILGGFGGFLSRPQRVHDFMLGRRNAQKLLLSHMALPANNPLFATWRDKPFADAYKVRDDKTGETVTDRHGQPFLPIIPLLRGADGKQLMPVQKEMDWPKGHVDTAAVARKARARAEALAPPLLDKLSFFKRNGIRALLALWGYREFEQFAEDKLKAALKTWDL